ncbi:MAG: anaerobic ribonucleoside-triphosphate reductase activating protein [Mediterraneibacter faecis]
MNYGEIKKCDIANGEGVRVALFVSGCRHHCKGCFNSMTWDFNYGKKFTEETEEEILEALKPNYIDGLSLLGGEPFEPENQEVLVKLLRKVKERYPEKNIWCYSGYLFDEELKKESRARCEYTDEMLSMLDVLVDGRFEEDKKNITLLFRGSENQRLIDVKKSLKEGQVVEWKPAIKKRTLSGKKP